MYARAREERADRLFEELFEIADKPCTNQVEVQQQRNRLDTRKWALSKLAPRKYGDRVEHDHKGGLKFQPAVLVQIGGGECEDVNVIEGDASKLITSVKQ
jgi:terminase small subunit-like protein